MTVMVTLTVTVTVTVMVTVRVTEANTIVIRPCITEYVNVGRGMCMNTVHKEAVEGVQARMVHETFIRGQPASLYVDGEDESNGEGQGLG